jgi:MraZ protein
VFRGNYSNSIDGKGRCIIPARFRLELKGRCILVKGFDDCIYMFSEEGYQQYADEHIENRPDEDDAARDLKFFFYSATWECDIDKQGRITLPQNFLEYADIQREMVNIGFGSRIEVWAKEKYANRISSAAMDPKKLIGRMEKYVPKP